MEYILSNIGPPTFGDVLTVVSIILGIVGGAIVYLRKRRIYRDIITPQRLQELDKSCKDIRAASSEQRGEWKAHQAASNVRIDVNHPTYQKITNDEINKIAFLRKHTYADINAKRSWYCLPLLQDSWDVVQSKITAAERDLKDEQLQRRYK